MIITEYRVPGKVNLNVALVTDLHERDPEELLKLLRSMEPDAVCVAGDTFERFGRGRDPYQPDRHHPVRRVLKQSIRYVNYYAYKCLPSSRQPNTNHAYRFLREAAALRNKNGGSVPVFLSLGNHERELNRKDLKIIRKTGVQLLDNADVLWNGIRIGGLSTKADLDFLDRFCASSEYKILLCHHPDYYDPYLRGRDIDLILSGHIHGGQIRIFGRGLLSPAQGLFPRYARGFFHGNLVISAGCANTTIIPRWGNPTEVVEVRVESTKE